MSVSVIRALVASVLACGSPAPMPIADTAVDLHWSPSEDLEHIDLGLVASSRRTIDMAGFVLTDYAVITALRERADAAVRVRLLLDGRELEELLSRNPGHPLRRAARHPNIEIKVTPPAVRMHLKAYAVDGEGLRFRSANFSPSGLKRQDNELAIVRDRSTAQRFGKIFEALWSRIDNTSWRRE
jgi:phosphatidylserine/phosphatidylglycerophosphate/cardiolipin synthase-like enzyme